MKSKLILFFFITFLFSLTFISAYGYGTEGSSNFGYDTEVSDYLKKGGDTTTGDYLFNGGWEDGGLSIINGSIYGQLGFFYNITSLNITKQDLTITENLDVLGNVTANSFFGEQIFAVDNINTYVEFLYYGINIVSNGITSMSFSDSLMEINNAGVDYDLRFRGLNDDALFYLNAGTDRIGIGTSSPSSKLDVAGNFEVDGNDFFVNATSGNVGIGTATPSHTLNVVGNINVTEYVYSKNQVAQFHREENKTADVADTWYNITWDLSIPTESTGDWYDLTDSNNSITINGFSGIVRVQGCVHPYNNNVGTQDATMWIRVLNNGVEARCLQASMSKSFKASGIDLISYVGTINVNPEDVINVQWRVDNTNLMLRGDTTFDNPVSASVNFEKISI